MPQNSPDLERMLSQVRAEVAPLPAQERAVALNELIKSLVALQCQALEEREKSKV